MATIGDVARLAGVSAGTVSNVLNRPSYVAPETRARVENAIKELGFVPHPGARRYRAGRARTIGLAMADLDEPVFVSVALGAEARAREFGVGVVICNSGGDPAREDHNLDLLVQQRVQGIVISAVDEKSSRLQAVRNRGVPTVFVDRVRLGGDATWVQVDDLLGGKLAAEYLLSRGHRKIAFHGDPKVSLKVQARLKGAQTAVQSSGVPAESIEVLKLPPWTLESGHEAAALIAQREPSDRPTAVFCSNDRSALGLVHALIRAGLRVPEDVAVVGYDDVSWAQASVVPLTTIRQPLPAVGASAVDILLRGFESPTQAPQEHVVLRPELVVRDSA